MLMGSLRNVLFGFESLWRSTATEEKSRNDQTLEGKFSKNYNLQVEGRNKTHDFSTLGLGLQFDIHSPWSLPFWHCNYQGPWEKNLKLLVKENLNALATAAPLWWLKDDLAFCRQKVSKSAITRLCLKRQSIGLKRHSISPGTVCRNLQEWTPCLISIENIRFHDKNIDRISIG